MDAQNNQKNESISELLKKYKEKYGNHIGGFDEQKNPILNKPNIDDNQINLQDKNNNITINTQQIINKNDINDIKSTIQKETDPDLMITYELVKLPSKGLFYSNKLSELAVEYLTSKDEDMLTTPTLIESGAVIDMLLKRKIKTPNVKPEDLLPGDRNAIILFLRTSSYGTNYTVQVTDPRNNTTFKTVVDLTKLKYKELKELPDEFGHFTVELPMRKKIVKFRLLTAGEENMIYKKAQALQEAHGDEFNQYSTMKLKSSIVAIGDNTDRLYIEKFVDAMPALDAYAIRKKMLEVSPDVDMTYEFETKDHYKFTSTLIIGLDFFFPSI